ncbi:MAG: c-type cytochrome [Proteobacteria bacterium]|nr:c-type cytochrome [Pseudomonadota bacterium]
MNRPDKDRSRKAGKGFRALGPALAVALGAAFGNPVAAQDVQTVTATVCAACHAEDGNSVIPMFPKIAGLQEAYIVKQLRDFMSGRRKSDVMAPVVAQLKPEDVAPLAAFYSKQKLKPGEADNKKAIGLGKLIFHDGNEETGVPACVGCHQPQGAGHGVYPRIGGQHTAYVTQQLKNFAASERSNDVSRFMRVTSKRMSEEEIHAVAEYLVGLEAK